MTTQINLIDPTGLDAVVVCGNGQACEDGSGIGEYKSFVTQYWLLGRYGFGDFTLDETFGLMQWVMLNWEWEPARVLEAFGVAFLDTSNSDSQVGSWASAGKNRSLDNYMDKLDELLGHEYFHNTNGRPIDTLIGFGQGGATIAKALHRNSGRWQAFDYYRYVQSVVFLDPAFNVRLLGNFFGVAGMNADDFPSIRFVTVNGAGSWVTGTVAHTNYNFTSFECVSRSAGHCSHGEHGALIVNLAMGSCVPASYATYDVLSPGVACLAGYR